MVYFIPELHTLFTAGMKLVRSEVEYLMRNKRARNGISPFCSFSMTSLKGILIRFPIHFSRNNNYVDFIF